MILEFSVENYRSFREKQVLSLLPDEGKHELEESLFTVKGDLKLLTNAVVYGANASGKSNLMRAIQALRNLVLSSGNNSPDKIFAEYDSFKFHQNTAKAPVSFGLDFLLQQIRYRYEVSILRKEVVKESLYFFPLGKEAKLFVRRGQTFEFGEYLKGQKVIVAELTSSNQLFLSKAAINNIQQLIEVFQFFNKDLMAIPFLDSWIDSLYMDRIAKELLNREENGAFVHNFENLLRGVDTGIVNFKIEENDLPFGNDYDIAVNHNLFDNEDNIVGNIWHPIEEESTGTQKIFVLGGLVLRALMNGRTIIIDEFERSLHPFISNFIIQLFHDIRINTKGAQLIIATHDTNLLSESNLRRDQIWIVEKDQQGASSLFSLADVNGIRAESPFEKWYLSGRFGGVPGIEKLNFELNFQHEEV